MAMVGMLHPVAATISSEVEGSAITYSAGMVIGKAISANITMERNDNPLYADDSIAETDNGITGGTIEVNTDDLLESVRKYMLGLKDVTVGSNTEYDETEEAAPYVGFGFIQVRRKNGATSYKCHWFHKVIFGESNESAQTKGESIEWQTPTITGRIMGVRNDSSMVAKYRRIAVFDTLASATSWINGKAGIT